MVGRRAAVFLSARQKPSTRIKGNSCLLRCSEPVARSIWLEDGNEDRTCRGIFRSIWLAGETAIGERE